MKALSVQQPWAYLLFLGKDIENRTWRTEFRGELLIHASMTVDQDAMIQSHIHGIKIPKRSQLKTGGIIGKVTIVDCVEESDSIWFEGPYGLVIGSFQRLKFRPYKGALGFFEVEGRW